MVNILTRQVRLLQVSLGLLQPIKTQYVFATVWSVSVSYIRSRHSSFTSMFNLYTNSKIHIVLFETLSSSQNHQSWFSTGLCRSVVVSLRLLPKLFASFQHFRGGVVDTHQVTLWALKEHAMMDRFFDNLKECAAANHLPLTHVQVRLQFLTHIYSPLGLPDSIRWVKVGKLYSEHARVGIKPMVARGRQLELECSTRQPPKKTKRQRFQKNEEVSTRNLFYALRELFEWRTLKIT